MAKEMVKLSPGIRYRKHTTRKHGKKFDRYFYIYCRVDGKVHERGLGWESEGITESEATMRLLALKKELREIKDNQREGKGPQTYKAKKAIEKAEAQAEQVRQERQGLTYGDIFTEKYFPYAQRRKKEASVSREEQFYRLWIEPVIGHMPIIDIGFNEIEQIKNNMVKGLRPKDKVKIKERGKIKVAETRQASPRTIHYCLACIRQVFNFAKDAGLFEGKNPVKIRKVMDRELNKDNKRLRWLTHEEADSLLEALRERSPNTADAALLSLHCGLRRSEVLNLTWGDVDLSTGILTLRDTKSGKTRHVNMTTAVQEMVKDRPRGIRGGPVFTSTRGKNKGAGAVSISKVFDDVVRELAFNEGVTDPRQRVVFHTMRHTYASWLVQSGVDLYTVQKLLGHSTIALTERYSHLAPSNLQNAVRVLEQSIEAARTKKPMESEQL